MYHLSKWENVNNTFYFFKSNLRGSGPVCALVHPSMLLRLPEKCDDKHQSISQPKLTRPISKPVQVSWVTKGPPRNYRPWPTNNKFDQNTSHKNKMDDANHSNISKASPVHSWNSSKLKTKQKQPPQQQLQQQNIKVCEICVYLLGFIMPICFFLNTVILSCCSCCSVSFSDDIINVT